MEMYNDDIFHYLVANDDVNVCYGMGYYIKEGTPPEQIEIIRKFHDDRLDCGQAYFILDFLAEDLERDPDSVEYNNGLSFYRKRKTSPDENKVPKLSPIHIVRIRNLKRSTDEPAVTKLIQTSSPIPLGNQCVFEIPEGSFTPEEIEILRKIDAERQSLYNAPFVANFLPDDVRPAGIKKM